MVFGNGGTLIGLGRSHDRETLAAAVFEGILFQLRLILSVFAQRGQATDALTVVGAFGRSDQFAQRFADTTGQGIRLLRNAEHATALGAAMLGFVGLQVLPDLAGARSWIQHEPTSYPREGTELATKRYDIFAATWPAVRETSARLADLAKPR